MNDETIDIDTNTDEEEIENSVTECLRMPKDSKPNIIVKNNQVVNITINNFNETEREWSREDEE